MKIKSITIKDLRNNLIYNLKNRKKILLLVLSFFIVFGLAVGYYESSNFSSETKYKAYKYGEISFSNLNSDDADYYFKCMSLISMKFNDLRQNLNCLSHMELNSNNMTQTQALIDACENDYKEKMIKLEENFKKYTPVEYEKKNEFIGLVDINISDIDDEIENYNSQISNYKDSQNPAAVEAFSKAENNLEIEVKAKNKLEKIREKVVALTSSENNYNCQFMYNNYMEIAEVVNTRIKAYNALISEIAVSEKYIITDNLSELHNQLSIIKTDIVRDAEALSIDSSGYYAKSTYSIDTSKDRFASFFIFVLMIGFGVTFLVGIFKGK